MVLEAGIWDEGLVALRTTTDRFSATLWPLVHYHHLSFHFPWHLPRVHMYLPFLVTSVNTQYPRSLGHTWKAFVGQGGRKISTWIRKIIADKHWFYDGTVEIVWQRPESGFVKKGHQVPTDGLETGEEFKHPKKEMEMCQRNQEEI